MKKLFNMLGLIALLSGCGITDADRQLAREQMALSGANCIHIQGSGEQ